MKEVKYHELLVDSSRAIADLVVDQVGHDQIKHRQLFNLAKNSSGQLAMRAARAFDLCDEAHPGLAEPLLSEIRTSVYAFNHLSVARCFLRLLLRYPLPQDEEELGQFYLFSIETMQDQKLPIALRYYGMRIAFEVCLLMPDLRFELFPMYEEIARNTEKGLKGRAVICISELEKKFGRD